MSHSHDLMVEGYLRMQQSSLHLAIPSDISAMILAFYPAYMEFEGSSIALTVEERTQITFWIAEAMQQPAATLTASLLFDYNTNYATPEENTQLNEDPKSWNPRRDFHGQCVGYCNTLCIIQTAFNEHTFGCFLSKKIGSKLSNQRSQYIADEQAFLCVIRSGFAYHQPEIFKIRRECHGKAYWDTRQWGPSFGPKDLTLFSDSSGNTCNHQDTVFDQRLCGNLLCGGDALHTAFTSRNGSGYRFKIKEMNTFHVHQKKKT